MIFPGFVGSSYTLPALQASAEECLNLFPETQESEHADPRKILRGTPGLSRLMTLPDPPTRGQFEQDGRSWAVGGGTFYETTTGAPVVIGAVANNFLPVQFSSNGQDGHQLMLLSAGTVYCFDLISGVFTNVSATAVGFPTAAIIGLDYLNGFFIVATTIGIAISGTLDGLSWNAAQVGQRLLATDNLAAILGFPPVLWMVGTLQTEIWIDNGASVFPFGPIANVIIDWGIAARLSLTRVDNTVGWVAQNRYGSRVVVLASSAYVPIRISTHAVEASLQACASVSDFVGYVYQEQGHTFYVLTSPVNQITWVYDVGEKLWHRRAYKNPVNGNVDAQLAWNHISTGNSHWVGDRRNGNIYQQSLSYYSDNGDPIVAVRAFPHITKQQYRVFYPGLRIDGQMGIGLNSGQGADPTLMLDWSEDGGETYGNILTASMGRVGAYGNSCRFNQLGSGPNRVFRISMSDPVPRTFTQAYLDPDPLVGTH